MHTNKQVYIIRHGESTTNKTRFHLGPHAQLTELGREQAEKVALRLGKLPITRIISSPYIRAIDTATPTAQAFSLPIHVSEHFRERSGPSILHGLHEDAPLVRTVWDEIEKNYGNHSWKHSDEENFTDLVLRVGLGLRDLEKLTEEHIAVFSHGLTMKMVFAYILLGGRLNGDVFQGNFLPIKNIANTGVLHIQYTDHPRKKGKYWKLISWNDHAHLD